MLHGEAQQKTPDSPWAYLDHAKVRFQSMSSMVSPYCLHVHEKYVSLHLEKVKCSLMWVMYQEHASVGEACLTLQQQRGKGAGWGKGEKSKSGSINILLLTKHLEHQLLCVSLQ